MKQIQILTTGGTIASLPQDNGDVSATLSGQDLIHRLGVKGEVKVKSLITLGSFAFDYETLYTIAMEVENALEDPEVGGVVITHGTDTMEETAFYLSLVTGHFHKPVILTGAQLDASYSFTDGMKNLQDAIYAAQSKELKDFGALIVFAGFVHAARDVYKVDTHALEGFASPGWGPIARVDDEKVVLARQIKPTISLDPVVPEPVALIRLAIGMSGAEFRKMIDGYAGVVIEAFGRGNAHPTISDEVNQLVKKEIPVIVTSRCLRGSVLPVYGNGGGKDLERAGAWFAGDLAGEKARILLGTMLANRKSWDEMKTITEHIGNH